MKVAIPRFGERVAPCFEHSATITIFLIDGAQVVDQIDFSLTTPNELDRIKLLRDQQVDTLICGGVRDRFEDLLQALGIQVISWVSGNVEALLMGFIRGKLIAGSGKLGD